MRVVETGDNVTQFEALKMPTRVRPLLHLLIENEHTANFGDDHTRGSSSPPHYSRINSLHDSGLVKTWPGSMKVDTNIAYRLDSTELGRWWVPCSPPP